MRVISFNANGIRSAAKKGFFEWLAQQDADVVCLQEVRAHLEQLSDQLFKPQGYNCYFFSSHKKGYGGVAVFCKQCPDNVKEGLGWETADSEGRYLEVNFGDLHIASLYMPSGSSGEIRQAVKYDFMDRYLPILKTQIKSGKKYILCGDWNIAHQNIDIKNWRGNQKSSGFLPEERAWLDTLFGKVGFVDAFRFMHPDKVEYTWWSQRQRTAWENNVGWRIDYQIITPNLSKNLVSTSVYRGEKFSDHAPVIMDYDLSY